MATSIPTRQLLIPIIGLALIIGLPAVCGRTATPTKPDVDYMSGYYVVNEPRRNRDFAWNCHEALMHNHGSMVLPAARYRLHETIHVLSHEALRITAHGPSTIVWEGKRDAPIFHLHAGAHLRINGPLKFHAKNGATWVFIDHKPYRRW